MLETCRTSYAICPYCGHRDLDSWEIEMPGDPGGEGTTEVSCGACGKEYIVERLIDVRYTTRRIGEANNA